MSFEKGLKKRAIAVILTAVMATGSVLPATSAVMAAEDSTNDNAVLANAEVPKENYSIRTEPLFTRLHTHWDEPEFELGFKVRWDDEDENRFTEAMGVALLNNGKIQINNGKEWSFKDAGLEFASEDSKSSFVSHKKAFLKEFCDQDNFKITVTTPEGYKIVAENISNEMDENDRLALKNDTSVEPETGTEQVPTPDVPSVNNQFTIDTFGTCLKTNYGGDNVLRIDFQELSGSDPKKEEVLKSAEISINNKNFGKMANLGFVITQNFGYELTDLTKIASEINKNELAVVVTTPDGQTSFTIQNQLSQEQRQEIAGQAKPEGPAVSSNVVIGDCKVQLVKADDPNEPSMSGTTMEETAQLITDKDGNNVLVLHFKPAEIMGILAWATKLELNGLEPQFSLREDNSGICIIPVEAFSENEKVFAGHIYSNVMDADVALKVSKPAKTTQLKDALDGAIKSVEKRLEDGQFYEETKEPVLEALEAAKKDSANPVKAYTDLLKAEAGLRAIVADPFEGNTLFHLEAIDTSTTFAKSLDKYVRVEIKDNKKILTAHYNSYLDWDGLIYAKDIKVLDQDQKEIPVEYKLDENKNGTLIFTMPYVPASGIFKVKITNGDGKQIESTLKMNYSTIVKGPFKQLLTDAIEKYGYYTSDDYNTRLDMVERKEAYTDTSWKNFEEVLKRCNEHLHTAVMQDVIDQDVADLKAARENLMYKIKAGHGDTANSGIAAINAPSAPYYPSDAYQEYPELVGWAGSKVIFGKGNGVYRVLSNGQANDDEVGTGHLLLMAENVRVKAPFNTDEDNTETRWKDSQLRATMNEEFYNNTYSNVEKSAIINSEITTYDYSDSGFGLPMKKMGSEIKTTDKVFAPSMEMMTNEKYGYGSNDSRITSSEYALRDVLEDSLGDTAIMKVSAKGRLGGGFLLSSDRMQAAPCINIDASKILMTIDAETGLSDKMTAVKPLESNLWKLVLQDESLSIKGSPKAKIKGNQIALDLGSYKDEAMAVVIEGNDFATGKIKSYGKVNAGKITLKSFDPDKEKLYVMAIHDGEGAIAASEPVPVTIDGKIDTQEPQTPEDNDHHQSDISIGTIDMKMLHETKNQASMCNAMFDTKASVEVKGNDATIKVLVANPVPNFMDQGKDGTVKNMSVIYKGKTYKAQSDITSKPLMTAKETNTLFGLEKNQQYPAQVLTFVLPKDAIQEEMLTAKAYVNVVMMDDVDFRIELSNLKLEDATEEGTENKEEVKVENKVVENNKVTAEITGDAIIAGGQSSDVDTTNNKIQVDATVHTNPEDKPINDAQISIKKETAKAIAKTDKALEIKTNVGTVNIDKKLAQTIADKGQDVTLVIKAVEKPAELDKFEEDVVCYELKLEANNKAIDFDGAQATVTVPAVAGTKYAYHVENGELMEKCPVTINNDGTMSWTTNHFSTWALSGKDVETAKEKDIKKAAAKVDTLISAIGKVTKDSKADIEAARDAYDKLTAEQKDLVEDYNVLLAAEKAYAKLTKETAEAVYEVPVKMMNATHANKESMGNQALDGNAIVTVGKDTVTYAFNFKGIEISGLYGHLLKLWSYEDGVNGTPIAATPSNPYQDTNLKGKKDNFYKTFTIERDGNKTEDQIYIRISVDAMSGFDQDALLVFDWDKAEEVEVQAADKVAAKAVDDQIAAIGKVTLESEKAIKEARASYDALTAVQKKLVNNLETLEKAEATLKELKGEIPSANFKDVLDNAWYKEAVDYVYAKGLMVGTSDDFFSPEMTTTRGMIVTMLYRLEGEPSIVAGNDYTDVPRNEWYSKAISWANKNGIVAGYGNGTFGPNDTITREQMATILYRYADYKGYDLNVAGNLAQYADQGNIHAWAHDALSWANGQQLITGMGDGTIAPQGNALRMQVASIMMRFCENVVE